MNSKPKKQSTSAAGDQAKVALKDLKPKKDVKGGLRGRQFAGGVQVASADLGGDNGGVN